MLAVLIGAADATVAVPEAAQAVVAAALAAFTERSPAAGGHRRRASTPSGWATTCPACSRPRTATAAEADVVGALAGPVTVLPAWETLPFERVSPEIETMGRRLAVLHALTGGAGPGPARRRPG